MTFELSNPRSARCRITPLTRVLRDADGCCGAAAVTCCA
jgi:hypothetical protein